MDREKIISEIYSYLDLKEGWDGGGEVLPNKEDIEFVTKFINLIPSKIPDPIPMIETSGEISLYWKTEKLYIEMNFSNNEMFLFGTSKNKDLSNKMKIYGDHISYEYAIQLLQLIQER